MYRAFLKYMRIFSAGLLSALLLGVSVSAEAPVTTADTALTLVEGATDTASDTSVPVEISEETTAETTPETEETTVEETTTEETTTAETTIAATEAPVETAPPETQAPETEDAGVLPIETEVEETQQTEETTTASTTAADSTSSTDGAGRLKDPVSTFLPYFLLAGGLGLSVVVFFMIRRIRKDNLYTY